MFCSTFGMLIIQHFFSAFSLPSMNTPRHMTNNYTKKKSANERAKSFSNEKVMTLSDNDFRVTFYWNFYYSFPPPARRNMVRSISSGSRKVAKHCSSRKWDFKETQSPKSL